MRHAQAAAFALAFAALAALAGCAANGPGAEEEMEVIGILTEEGTDCQALRSEDGELYGLTGEMGDVRSGDKVRVRGTQAPDGTCQEGIALRVVSLEVTDGPNTGERVGEAEGEDGEGEGTGQLFLEGELTEEGVECPAFRGDDGELYTLTGELGEYGPGDRVRIVAEPVEVSTCMQGTTVKVIEISAIDEEPPAGEEEPPAVGGEGQE